MTEHTVTIARDQLGDLAARCVTDGCAFRASSFATLSAGVDVDQLEAAVSAAAHRHVDVTPLA